MDKIDVNGFITLGAIIVYVIIFFIQKSQIDSQKGIIESMKTFVEIFDIEKVRAFSKMNEETTMHNAAKLVLDKPQVKELLEDIIERTKKPIEEYYKEHLTESNNELINVCFGTVINQKEELRERFMDEYLPMNKAIIKSMILNSEKNKT